MTADATVRRVYVLLLVLAVVALALSTSAAHDLLSGRGAAAVAAGIALVKARFVAQDFMELRGTGAGRVMDAWLAVVGAVSIVLVLR